jgi:cobalt/nickel transport system permease protein
LHYAEIERWSQGASFLHRRDARAKAVALLVLLTAVATSPGFAPAAGGMYFALLIACAASARVPIGGALARAAGVLPFSLAFAAAAALAGDPARALVLAAKSYLSALAALLLVATTPLPKLLRGFEGIGVPRFLLMVGQFIYRYLFVIAAEASSMRLAALGRGGFGRSGFRAAAGALAVLFARSYGAAENIHRSMLSRGFEGHFHLMRKPGFGPADWIFVLSAAAVVAAVRAI